MPKYTAMSTTALGEGTKLAAWHLQLFAVLPELQNKGIGVSLMKALETKVNNHSLICSDYRLIIG
jgi:predicted N-acetyltransferase YhbS